MGPGAYRHLGAQPLQVPEPLSRKGCPGSKAPDESYSPPSTQARLTAPWGELPPTCREPHFLSSYQTQ